MQKSYKTLVVSNTHLRFHEQSPETLIDDDVDLIISAGQISWDNKRGLLYVEELAKKVPSATVIFNAAVMDCIKNGYPHQVLDGYKMRISSASNSPDNIVYPAGRTIGDFDVFCTVGWPTISAISIPLEGSWIKRVQVGSGNLYIGTKLVNDRHPFFAEVEDINLLAAAEEQKLKDWLNEDNQRQKVLVCGTHPNRDAFMAGIDYVLFPNLDLSNVVVVCAGESQDQTLDTSRFKRLINNPGRNTQQYVVL